MGGSKLHSLPRETDNFCSDASFFSASLVTLVRLLGLPELAFICLFIKWGWQCFQWEGKPQEDTGFGLFLFPLYFTI